MKNKGFTLMEMIAAIIIIALLTVLIVPTVMNQIADKKEEIDNSTKRIIYEAAELYMSNNASNYPKLSGNKYCISLDKLVQSGLLETPIKDFKTNKEIPLTQNVSVTVNEKGEYDLFELKANC